MSEYLKIRMNSDDDDLPERPEDNDSPPSDNEQEDTEPEKTAPSSPAADGETMFPPPHPMFPDAAPSAAPPPIPEAVSDPQVRLHVAQRPPEPPPPEPAEDEEEPEAEEEEKKKMWDPDDWACYWRATIVLGLVCALFGGFAGGLGGAFDALLVAFLVFFLCYPGYVLSLSLWRGNPGLWILATIVLTGSPLLVLIIGGIVFGVARLTAIRKSFNFIWPVLLIVVLVISNMAPAAKPDAEAIQEETERLASDTVLAVVEMQKAFHERNGIYANDLPLLFATQTSDVKPNRVSKAFAAMREGRLFTRERSDGFDVAIRKNENEWLVYSWPKDEGAEPAVVASDSLIPPYMEKKREPPAAVESTPVPKETEPEPETEATPKETRQETGEIEVAAQAAVPEKLKLVEDPKGYYTVELVPGFKVSDKSQAKRSKRTYAYNPNLSVTMIASTTRRTWDAEKELARKLAAIDSGKSPLPPKVKVADSGPVNLANSPGYEISFAGTHGGRETKMHAYATVKDETSISISVVCGDPEQFGVYESILASIKETLRLQTGNDPAGKPGSKKGAQAKSKWAPTEEDWRQAEAAVDFVGVMKRGDALVALIGRDVVRQGDTISVEYKGHGYSFTVEEITDYELKLKPVNEQVEEDEGE